MIFVTEEGDFNQMAICGPLPLHRGLLKKIFRVPLKHGQGSGMRVVLTFALHWMASTHKFIVQRLKINKL